VNIEIDCVTCQVNQIIRTILVSKADNWIDITSKAFQIITKYLGQGTNVIPAFITSEIQRLINTELKCDPYKKIRADSNIIADRILRDLEYKRGKLTIKEYCLLSAVSNAFDFAVIETMDECKEKIWKSWKSFNMGFLKDDFEVFNDLLNTKKSLLYFTDNAGEIVFDKALIGAIKENFDINIKVVINKNPILNDATLEEIVALGFKDVVDEIIGIEPEFVGIDLNGIHKYLKDYFTEDSFIVSKGMANYECFHGADINIPIIAILLTKCNPIANSVGVASLDAPVLTWINPD